LVVVEKALGKGRKKEEELGVVVEIGEPPIQKPELRWQTLS
jgi:hypothetical protein